jgi:hypothetical protein
VGVYSIPYEDISCVVSDSEITDFTHMRKDVLARQLVRHQTVAERIMNQGYMVIPVRLGTFVKDNSEVRHILSKAYPVTKEIFEKIKEKIEIDLAIVWSDFNSVIKEIGEEHEIKVFKEHLQVNSKGITIDDQMKIGLMVKNALDKKREEYTQKIKDALKVISHDFKIHELMDDKMVFNIAYLLDKAKQKDFERAIERLNVEFNEKLNFRCVGPLPPYSFYTLEVKKVEFEDIDWARKRLGILDSSITQEEIKKAYHRQAFSFHPDKNSERLNSEEEFNEVNKAYKMLLDYCEACRQSGKPNSCQFNENEFKENAILVKLRE